MAPKYCYFMAPIRISDTRTSTKTFACNRRLFNVSSIMLCADEVYGMNWLRKWRACVKNDVFISMKSSFAVCQIMVFIFYDNSSVEVGSTSPLSRIITCSQTIWCCGKGLTVSVICKRCRPKCFFCVSEVLKTDQAAYLYISVHALSCRGQPHCTSIERSRELCQWALAQHPKPSCSLCSNQAAWLLGQAAAARADVSVAIQ